MRIAILQTNPLIGDVRRNFRALEDLIRRNAQRADLFVTPEQALLGYPARDLLSQKWILEKEKACLDSLRLLSQELGVGILVGHCEARTGPGRPLHNAATLFDSGAAAATARKRRIPAYDIFEEERFFEPAAGGTPQQALFRGVKLAVAICEDGWDSVLGFGLRDVRTYPKNSAASSVIKDSDILVNLSASPYGLDKRAAREDLFRALAGRHARPLIYANSVGGQDDVLFDGRSFVTDAQGRLVAQAAAFKEEVLIVEWQSGAWAQTSLDAPAPAIWDDAEAALVMGLRDFVHKSGAEKVVLGLSGGIDSALCAALAVRALGAGNVLGVSLPSALTSDLSKSEAAKLARGLKIEYREIPIHSLVQTARDLTHLKTDLAFENLQSRTRALILNSLANDERRLLLSTGNKSELAMGYSTLYGDLCGALLPLGDLYKTEVYALSHHLNQKAIAAGAPAPIPEATLTRAPTAELAPGQKDSDSLPEYDILDAILKELIENQGATMFEEGGWDKILAPRFTVDGLRKRYLSQEFKRRQAPPILKVHQRSFGSGWKMPVTKGFT